MSIRPSSGGQPPAPRGKGNLNPLIVLGIAISLGSVAAYSVDWKTAFLVFVPVLSLFTPRSRSE